ncbi:MAG: hypothetical protein ACI9NY_001318 [Kiritimatiellia bacterium]|jgi:hypothetical protein
MIKIKTKKEIRQELDDEVNRFLSKGGAISDIEQGASGKEMGVNINNSIPLNNEKQTRTPLTNEVNALDQRKKSKLQATKKPAPHRPKKKVIYDDFGEPLREVWE